MRSNSGNGFSRRRPRVNGKFQIYLLGVVVFIISVVTFLLFVVRPTKIRDGRVPTYLRMQFKTLSDKHDLLKSLNANYVTSDTFVPLVYVSDALDAASSQMTPLPVPIFRLRSELTTTTAAAATDKTAEFVHVGFETITRTRPNRPVYFNYETGKFSSTILDDEEQSLGGGGGKIETELTRYGVIVRQRTGDQVSLVENVNWPIPVSETQQFTTASIICSTLDSDPILGAGKHVTSVAPQNGQFGVTLSNIVALTREDVRLEQTNNIVCPIYSADERRRQDLYSSSSFGSCETGSYVTHFCKRDPVTQHQTIYAGGGRCVVPDRVSYECIQLNERTANLDVSSSARPDPGQQGRVLVDASTLPNTFAQCRVVNQSKLPFYDKPVLSCPDDKPLFDSKTQTCGTVESVVCADTYNGSIVLPHSDGDATHNPLTTYVQCINGVPTYVDCTHTGSALMPLGRRGCVDPTCIKYASTGYTHAETSFECDQKERDKIGLPYAIGTFMSSGSVSGCTDGLRMSSSPALSAIEKSESMFKVLDSTRAELDTRIIDLKHLQEQLQTRSKHLQRPVDVVSNRLAFTLQYALPNRIYSSAAAFQVPDSFRDVPAHIWASEKPYLRVRAPITDIGSSRGFLYYSMYINVLDMRHKNIDEPLELCAERVTPPRVLDPKELEFIKSQLLESYTHLYATSWVNKDRLWAFDIQSEDFLECAVDIRPPSGIITSALIDHGGGGGGGGGNIVGEKKPDVWAVVIQTKQTAPNLPVAKRTQEGYIWDMFGYSIDDYIIRPHVGVERKNASLVDRHCEIPDAEWFTGTYYKTRDNRLCDDRGALVHDTHTYPCTETLKLAFKFGHDDASIVNTCRGLDNPLWWSISEKKFDHSVIDSPDVNIVCVHGVNSVNPLNRTILSQNDYYRMRDNLINSTPLTWHSNLVAEVAKKKRRRPILEENRQTNT